MLSPPRDGSGPGPSDRVGSVGSDLSATGMLRIVLAGVAEYFRWSQLVPLFTAWLMATGGVLLVVLVTFQGNVDAMLVGLESRVEELPWLERLAGRIPDLTTDGPVEVDSGAVARWIGGAWAGLSAVLFVGSGIRRSIWGAPPRRTLRQNLGRVLVVAGVYWGILQLTRILAPISFGDTVGRWALVTGLMLLLVVVISTWSLAVSHFLALLRDGLLAEETR